MAHTIETQDVRNWMEASEESYNYFVKMAKDSKDAAEFAERLEEDHEAHRPEGSGVYSDLLTRALARVDWDYIGQLLWEEYTEA